MPIDRLQLRAIRENSEPIMGSGAEYGPLMDLIGFVLIGEASHGTHEFYHTRASLTRTATVKRNGINEVSASGAVGKRVPRLWLPNRKGFLERWWNEISVQLFMPTV